MTDPITQLKLLALDTWAHQETEKTAADEQPGDQGYSGGFLVSPSYDPAREPANVPGAFRYDPALNYYTSGRYKEQEVIPEKTKPRYLTPQEDTVRQLQARQPSYAPRYSPFEVQFQAEHKRLPNRYDYQQVYNDKTMEVNKEILGMLGKTLIYDPGKSFRSNVTGHAGNAALMTNPLGWLGRGALLARSLAAARGASSALPIARSIAPAQRSLTTLQTIPAAIQKTQIPRAVVPMVNADLGRLAADEVYAAAGAPREVGGIGKNIPYLLMHGQPRPTGHYEWTPPRRELSGPSAVQQGNRSGAFTGL
jgi:hypothetical protein